jgi:hypothetical protein
VVAPFLSLTRTRVRGTFKKNKSILNIVHKENIMILMGFTCPNCGGDVHDSVTHCPQCKHEYLGTLAVVAAAHGVAKKRLVEMTAQLQLSGEVIMRHSQALGAVSEGLAAMIKAGGHPSSEYIVGSFVEMFKELQAEAQ